MKQSQIYKLACEESLSFFSQQAFKQLEPETEYQHNWHVDVLCAAAEAVYYGHVPNIDVNIPPRTIKSLIYNIFLPAWIWTRDPSFKFISSSHSDSLSTGFNIKRRELITSDWYQKRWPLIIKDDANRQNFFANTRNGFMSSVSVGGSVTGKGGDMLVSDDVLDAIDAYSEAKRKFANNWYSTSFYNRLQDKRNPKRINVMQRLHEQDLSGHIAEKYNFARLVMPMQKEEEQIIDGFDWVDPRKVGEFIHPERYGEVEKADEVGGLGAYGWAGQMQQRPAPLGGGVIKKEFFKYFRADHKFKIEKSNTIQVWDLTFKEKGSSYVVGAVFHKDENGQPYILDLVRGKWGFRQTKDEIIKLSAKWKEAKQIYVEDKANGSAIIDDLKIKYPGLKEWNPGSKSKMERLMAVEPDLSTEGLSLPQNGVWTKSFLDEALVFPNGSNDDQVDVMTMGLLILKKKRKSVYSTGEDLHPLNKTESRGKYA